MTRQNTAAAQRRLYSISRLAFVIVAISLTQQPSHANEQLLQGADCVFFEHWDYQGAALRLKRRQKVASFVPYGFNDKASSVLLRQGCQVTYHEHANFDGWLKNRSKSQPQFSKSGGSDLDKIGQLGGNVKENDTVSSASCSCNRPPPKKIVSPPPSESYKFLSGVKVFCKSSTTPDFTGSVEIYGGSNNSCSDANNDAKNSSVNACKKLGQNYVKIREEIIKTLSCHF